MIWKKLALHHHTEWKLFERKNNSPLLCNTREMIKKIKHQLQIILDDSSFVSVAHLNLKRLKDAIVYGWVISEMEHTAGRDKQTEASQRI